MQFLNLALTAAVLAALWHIRKIIMSTQAQAAAVLVELNAKLEKIGNETSASLAEIQALKDAAQNNAGEVGPELQAAIDAVVARAQAVDDLVQDAAPTEPPVDPNAP